MPGTILRVGIAERNAKGGVRLERWALEAGSEFTEEALLEIAHKYPGGENLKFLGTSNGEMLL